MEVTIPLSTPEEALALCGLEDRNLKILRDSLGVKVTARGNMVRLQGENCSVASQVLNNVLSSHRSGNLLPDDYVSREVERLRLLDTPEFSDSSEFVVPPADDGDAEALGDVPLSAGSLDIDAKIVEVSDSSRDAKAPKGGTAPGGRGRNRPLKAEERALVHSLARTNGQAVYIETMLRNEIVFSVGPAGTGKTFLAVNLAVHFLRAGDIRKLILCRPAVEAGEKLGFLPGDLEAKIDPYLRPLYDALNDVLGYEQVKRYMEREIIEIVPLAYMRGRTLNDAFIILDEGQNTTISQMKMFLTRMGAHSRIVVNGDMTQVDLPAGQTSGLIHAQRIIQNVKGIHWAKLHGADIVRHPLVQRIVEAYESELQGKSNEPS